VAMALNHPARFVTILVAFGHVLDGAR
jgi:hypothetical protein